MEEERKNEERSQGSQEEGCIHPSIPPIVLCALLCPGTLRLPPAPPLACLLVRRAQAVEKRLVALSPLVEHAGVHGGRKQVV